MASTDHKFRALLGKHRLINDKDRILIDYKGGHPTTSLLNFIKTGLEVDTPKKIKFVPICLFIEDQFNIPEGNNRSLILNNINDEAKRFQIPIFFSSLVDYYKVDDVCITDKIEDVLSNTQDNNVVDKVFKTSETLVNDLENIYRRRLLISAAKKLNCKYIFSPEISTDIASQILSDVALGRGSQIPSNTGFCDDRDGDVKILRPLKVFDIKELALYNYFHNLDPVILSVKPPTTSIQNFIEDFVDKLQSSYPATVTTILKTGDKLSMVNSKKKGAETCYICQSPNEVPLQPLTSSRAVDFSFMISDSKELVSMESTNVDRRICFSCSKIENFLL